MAELPTNFELRTTAREVGQWLYDAARVGLLSDPVPLEVPSVQAQFDCDEALTIKADRYAILGALGGIVLYHTIAGDGPQEAEFIEFAESSPIDEASIDDPYVLYAERLRGTFKIGEHKTAESPLAQATDFLLERLKPLTARDPSTAATRCVVNAMNEEGDLDIGSDSEGADEGALLVAQSAVAIARAQESTLLVEPVLTVARQLTSMSMMRSALSVSDFRSHPSMYIEDGRPLLVGQSVMDFDKAHLALTRNGYKLNMGEQNGFLPNNHPWLENNPRLGPTIKCVMRLVRLEPWHEHSALQNYLYAVVNKGYQLDLYDPDLALKWWEVRRDRGEELKAQGLG